MYSGSTFPWDSFGYVVWGIGASVIIPTLTKILSLPGPGSLRSPNTCSGLWRLARPYFGTAVLSGVVATIVLASTKGIVLGWYDAILLGYAWDSTLQKLRA